ncbi:MAG TPA: segregation/condensation protein A [Candidatus Paceibacterota bacterium]
MQKWYHIAVETESREGIYSIKTPAFEGPLGLLLSLVEKRKLFINDVSLAEVTEDYLKYINTAGAIQPEEVSSFIYVAATLILIKSKSLLPSLDLTSEEQGDIKNLEERLRLYKIFTELSGNVKNKFGKKIIFAPLDRKNDVLIFLPDEQITQERMMALARDVVGGIPKKAFLPKVEVKKVISIEEMLEKLTTRIQTALRMSFRKHFGQPKDRTEKVEVIVGFLAMLELVRRGILDATQEKDDIIIEKLEAKSYEPRS